MSDQAELIEQAQRTYDQLTLRIETAVARRERFPPRGRRTTAYFALEGFIQRLIQLRNKARNRLDRRIMANSS